MKSLAALMAAAVLAAVAYGAAAPKQAEGPKAAPKPARKPRATDKAAEEPKPAAKSAKEPQPAGKPVEKAKPAPKPAERPKAKPAYDPVFESPAPATPANPVDKFVFAKLASLKIKPILCSDAVFVRRAYLDITGRLPTADEAKDFIEDSKTENKRAALVNRLLDQPEHADYWAMKWSDILRIKAEFPVNLWPNAAQAYHRWVKASLLENKPYDQFARELLTSSGSNFRVPPVNFYRAMQDKSPEGVATAVALTLMGARVDSWPKDRFEGMAVCFSQIGYKPTSEWKEEIVFWDPYKSSALATNAAPGQDAVAKSVKVTNEIPGPLEKPQPAPKPLAAIYPDGTKTKIAPDRDPREAFADWLIRPDNPWFAKAAVNRQWAWVMGRGIIHEPDDLRDDNPPSNPELLAYLEKELISHKYDGKHVARLILTSATYQLSSIPRHKSPEAQANFAAYPLRRLEAEVLLSAVNRITGTTDLLTSAVPEPFTYIPKDMPAVAVADGSITSSFLTLFGRSARATGMENERVNEMASPQWLHMLNSGHLQDKLQKGPKLRALLTSSKKPENVIEKLYLTFLSRFPTEDEVKAALEYAKSGVVKGQDAGIDIAWSLINSQEFLMRH